MLSDREIMRVASALDGVPVLSTYIATASPTHTGRGPWQEELDSILGQLGDRLAGGAGPERTAYEAARSRLAASLDGGVQAPGFATLVTPDRVHLAQALAMPVATSAAWGRGARILPLLEATRLASRDDMRLEDLLALLRSNRGVTGVSDTLFALGQSAVSRLVMSPGFLDRQAAKADRMARLVEEQRGVVTLTRGDATTWLDAEGAGIACILRLALPVRRPGQALTAM